MEKNYNIVENLEYKQCKYCHQPMKKVECAKEEKCNKYSFTIHEVITFILWFISLFFNSYKEKLEKHKFKITCVNRDCIGYLDDCYVNKYLFNIN